MKGFFNLVGMFSIVNNTYKVKKMAQDNRNLLYINFLEI